MGASQGLSLIESLLLHGWSWKSLGAVLGLCCGILSPLFGAILTALSWLEGPRWHGFNLQRDGTVLLFLTTAFLIFGAHCLDLIDKDNTKRVQKVN